MDGFCTRHSHPWVFVRRFLAGGEVFAVENFSVCCLPPPLLVHHTHDGRTRVFAGQTARRIPVGPSCIIVATLPCCYLAILQPLALSTHSKGLRAKGFWSSIEVHAWNSTHLMWMTSRVIAAKCSLVYAEEPSKCRNRCHILAVGTTFFRITKIKRSEDAVWDFESCSCIPSIFVASSTSHSMLAIRVVRQGVNRRVNNFSWVMPVVVSGRENCGIYHITAPQYHRKYTQCIPPVSPIKRSALQNLSHLETLLRQSDTSLTPAYFHIL